MNHVVQVSSAVSCWRSTESISHQAFYFTDTLRHRTPSQILSSCGGDTASQQRYLRWNYPSTGPSVGRRTAVVWSPTRGRNTDRATDALFKRLHHPPTARQVRLAGPGPARSHERLESSFPIDSRPILGGGSSGGEGGLGRKPIRNRDRSAHITRQLPRIHRSPRRGLYRRLSAKVRIGRLDTVGSIINVTSNAQRSMFNRR